MASPLGTPASPPSPPPALATDADGNAPFHRAVVIVTEYSIKGTERSGQEYASLTFQERKPSRNQDPQPGLKSALLDLIQYVMLGERTNKQTLVEDVHAWLDSGKQGGLSDPRLPDRSGELPRLPVLNRELTELTKRIEFLSTPERADRLRQLDDLQDRLGKANRDIGSLDTARQEFVQKQKEIQDALNTARETLDAMELTLSESRVRLPQGVLNSEIDERLSRLKNEFKSWGERKDAASERAGTAALEAEKARNARNNERRALINATDTDGRPKHPQYRHDDFDPEEESDDRWQARLRLLEEVQLEESRKLAAERRKDWERRLKDQVLNRLNENVQAAERAIRQLRGYLDVRVGNHK